MSDIVSARLTDSRQYGHLWGTDEIRRLFDERSRLQSWLDILAALASAQATLGMIPAEAATSIRTNADAQRLDLEVIAAETRRTSHSMLGLIRAMRDLLPPAAFEHFYAGATVQDVTDTWFALLMRDVGSVVWRDLRSIEQVLLGLAVTHRDTVMAGRTHGQIGSPITFGFKVASWADEIRRHLDRLREGRDRWLTGQLGGAVGALGFFEPRGAELRAEFCAELGLVDPGISWLTSRDRIAEFAGVLNMICGTMARIGNEVYELQRTEIGELHEPTSADSVGSITMPHKRNPEASEHLDTLARLVRAQANVLTEGMVASHERDGRAWKAEWAALPEVCLLTSVSLEMSLRMLSGLVVDHDAMAANLHAQGDSWGSEQLLAGLTGKIGKHAAQQLMHRALAAEGHELAGVIAEVVATGVATAQECHDWTGAPALGATVAMVDEVVRRANRARMDEPESWR
ncbi:MAG: adenylosuccinate lyase family protein [Microbacteriaceae bacterium]